MIKASKIEPIDSDAEGYPDHKYGTKVDWMDCDADKFISHWLPKFDQQHGIDAPAQEVTYRPAPPVKPLPAPAKPIATRTAPGDMKRSVIDYLRRHGPTRTDVLISNCGRGAARELTRYPDTFAHVGGTDGPRYVKIWALRQDGQPTVPKERVLYVEQIIKLLSGSPLLTVSEIAAHFQGDKSTINKILRDNPEYFRINGEKKSGNTYAPLWEVTKKAKELAG